MEETFQLVDALSQQLTKIRSTLYDNEASLAADHKEFKNALLKFEEKSDEVRSLAIAAHDSATLEELERAEADVRKLQLDSHHVLVEAKRRAAKAALLGTRTASPKAASTGEALAEDVSDQLSRLDQSLRAQVDLSSRNVSVTERSVKTLSEVRHRYSEFSEINRHSQRLVKRYKEKKQREHMMIMAAFGVFMVVCLYVFLRRMPLLSLLLRLIFRTGSIVFTRRPAPPVNNNPVERVVEQNAGHGEL